jgi:hypothetical protein
VVSVPKCNSSSRAIPESGAALDPPVGEGPKFKKRARNGWLDCL